MDRGCPPPVFSTPAQIFLPLSFLKNLKKVYITTSLKSCREMISDLCDIYWEFIHFEWN